MIIELFIVKIGLSDILYTVSFNTEFNLHSTMWLYMWPISF